jgi:hypothetical protein
MRAVKPLCGQGELAVPIIRNTKGQQSGGQKPLKKTGCIRKTRRVGTIKKLIMKTVKRILTVALFMSTSALFAQKTAAGQMQVEWTTDIVLGKGYTITQTFEVDNANFIICYNANSGKTQIWNLDKGGLPVYDKTTHKGWTSLVYFQLNNKTYMFSYKEASGEVIFYEMSKSGISKSVV